MKRINNIQTGFLTDFSLLENVYLLGRMWADGGIFRGNINLYAKEGDLEFLFPFYKKMGIHTFYKRQRYKKDGSIFGKPSWTVVFRSKLISDFLIKNDFDKKSTNSYSKILNLIPKEKHYLFWRGYFDGDGCLYFKEGKALKLNFWSTINQDWIAHENMLAELGISFNINKHIRKNGKQQSSTIEIRKRDLIKKFGDYIYLDMKDNKIGLSRKFNIYLHLCQYLKDNQSEYKGISFDKRSGSWRYIISFMENGIYKRKSKYGFETKETAKKALECLDLKFLEKKSSNKTYESI